MTKRETVKTMSDICDRALIVLANQGIKETKLNLMMDLEFIDCNIDLDYDRLLAFDASDFAHDINGIYQNWNRLTKEMENCFAPRCSKPERDGMVRAETRAVDSRADDAPDLSRETDYVGSHALEPADENPGAHMDIQVAISDCQERGYNVVVEFEGHIETYHYDADVEKANGKYWAVENFVESHADLFDEKTIAGAAYAAIKARPLGPTVGVQFDRSRACNLYLMAARDLGTNLGGYDLVDLLADKTDWDLDKCRRLAKYVVSEPSIVDLLTGEGVPKDIPPTLAPPKAPCSHIAAIVTLVHIETGDQVKGEYRGPGRYDLVAQAFADLTGAGQWDEGQAYKVLDYFGWTEDSPPSVKRGRKPYAGTQFESDDDDDNGPVYGADARPENDDPGPYQA